jgi:hypothetical protein
MTITFPEKPPQERIDAALAVAKQYDLKRIDLPAETVIDQMVRALLGAPATYLGHYIANQAYIDWKNSK